MEKNEENKKKLKLAGFIIAGILILSVAIALVVAFFWEDRNMQNVNLYFYNTNTKNLEKENVYIQKGSSNEMLQEVLNRFFDSGPQKSNLIKTVNSDIEIYNVSIENDVYKVEFSDTYLNLSPKDEILFRSAFVWTLTDLEFINDVEFYIKDFNSLTDGSTYLGTYSRNNIKLFEEIPPRQNRNQNLVLYFADKETMKLKEEVRAAVVDPQRRSEYLVNALLQGPESGDNYFGETVKLRNIDETENTCYVNLSQDFLQTLSYAGDTEKLLIYSIVNTLTDEQNQTGTDPENHTNKVQFLVEGVMIQEDNYKGAVDITQPLGRDESLISE